MSSEVCTILTKNKRKIPNVVAACYKDYRVSATRTAVGLQCGTEVKEGLSGTSNWARHVNRSNHQKMRVKYDKFLPCLTTPSSEGQTSATPAIASYFSPVNKYKPKDPRQQAIRKAVVDFLVDCSLPIHLVEKKTFRALTDHCDSKYIHTNRNGVMADVEKVYNEQKRQLISTLSNVCYASITVDIWTGRTMCAYLGITAHYIQPQHSTAQL